MKSIQIVYQSSRRRIFSLSEVFRMQLYIILVLLLSISVHSISGHSIKTIQDAENEETITVYPQEENVPDTKVFDFLKNWVSPALIWNALGFPVAPIEEEEYSAILDLDPPTPNKVDVTQYNLELKDGLIKGDLPCQCGQPLGRIVGDESEKAKINDIPWTAALVLKNGKPKQPFCGATLINDRYLLTAGHCIRSRKPQEIEVWLNDEDYLLTTDTKSIVVEVEQIIKHPKYMAYFNDIALLKLSTPVDLGVEAQQLFLVNPVCLPVNNDEDYANFTGTVSGWGRTSGGGKVSPALLKIDVPIMSNEFCRNQTKYREAIKDNMLCAGKLEGGADACQGDSGGPLIVTEKYYNKELNKEDSVSYLVGIVSWGFGCAEPRSPGVYTRVSVYPEWILENTKDARWCNVPDFPAKDKTSQLKSI